jgi:SRSO17 transposase
MVESAVTRGVVGGWAASLGDLHGRIAGRFFRPEPRRRALAYLRGLLSSVERKNGWQLAEQAGEATPDGIQRLLAEARWDGDAVRDDLRCYVDEHLGDPAAVLVIDETGFVKKGTKSVGVRRQYSGTAGRIENCQVGVFLAYAAPRGRTFLDRELYLPWEWADDAERRREAGVPEEVGFATKPELARRMLERALDAGMPAAWVVGDEVYGGDRRLRLRLEGRGQPFVLTVSSRESVWVDRPGTGPRQVAASEVGSAVPAEAWRRLSAGDGAKGPRLYDWARVPLARLPERGREHWLLIRRGLTDPSHRGYAYFVAYAAAGSGLMELVRVAGTRWAVEESFEAAKGEVGLDQYEVRRWDGWYRHVTLALLAHAFLAVTRARAAEGRPSGGEPHPADRAGGPPPAGPADLGPRAPSRRGGGLVRVATAPPGAGPALPPRPPHRQSAPLAPSGRAAQSRPPVISSNARSKASGRTCTSPRKGWSRAWSTNSSRATMAASSPVITPCERALLTPNRRLKPTVIAPPTISVIQRMPGRSLRLSYSRSRRASAKSVRRASEAPWSARSRSVRGSSRR